MIKMEIGKTYNVTHCRKGNFTVQVISETDAWVTGVITDGHTKTMCPENMKSVGEEQPMRKSFLRAIVEVPSE